MNKIRILFLIIISLFLVPNMAMAEVDNQVDPFEGMQIVAQEIKYYKVITYYDNSIYETGSILNGMNNAYSESFEITEEEYNNASVDINDNYVVDRSTTIETAYKRMISSITLHGSTYRYINSLSWKIMPSVRSSDIIAIGFLPNVEPNGTPNFNISYTYPGGGSGNYSLHLFSTFNKGASCAFELPTLVNLSSLNIQFWFDVKKVNPSSTITYQAAYADYSHATSVTSLLNAHTYHTVNQSVGIVLGNSIVNNYDTITEAGATWCGTW